PAVIGEQQFHGLPFRIGRVGREEKRCYVGLGDGLSARPMNIPIGKKARRVIFAHRLVEGQFMTGAPLALTIAEYVFKLANGATIRVPIRERFEISMVPTYGGLLFEATLGQKAQL